MPVDAPFWDKVAEDYARRPVADPAAFERKIAIMTARLRPTDIVLDVGCGTGSLALRLAPAAAQVHGVDVSGEMTRIARGKAVGVDNVTFHTGPFDASFTAFSEGTLDMVCACSILHLVEDRHAALARIRQLLKPGGHLVTSTVCLGDTWVPYRPLLTVMRWLGKAPDVTILTAATLTADIARAGFVDVEAPDVGAKAEVAFLLARKPAEG